MYFACTRARRYPDKAAHEGQMLHAVIHGLAVGEAGLVDTHVHNAFPDAGISYTYPAKFPALANKTFDSESLFPPVRARTLTCRVARLRTVPMYAAATAVQPPPIAVLMELDKSVTGADLGKQSLLEVRKFQQAAAACEASGGCTVGAIVASAPVSSGAAALETFLPTLLTAAPLVRGVRETLWHQPPSYYLAPSYLESLRVLGRFNLSLDLLVVAAQVEPGPGGTPSPIAQLARALPSVSINVNHLAYPTNLTSSGVNASWAAGMRHEPPLDL